MSRISKLQNKSLRIQDAGQGPEIQVLCACDEKYLPHVATMLRSLLEHNGDCRIHFFHGSIGERELAKLRSLVERYGSEIVHYNVGPSDFKELPIDKWLSRATYYRFLAPRLLPASLDRVLYLDSDIIVRGSLEGIWNIDLTDYALAAVPDRSDDTQRSLGFPEGTKCFNAGVLLINLQFWRKNGVPERAIAFIRDYPEKVQYWDQDALNGTLVDRWVELPSCWNWQYWHRPPEKGIEKDPAIVHFHGDHKPWQWSNAHPFRAEYIRNRRNTPWPYREEGAPPLPQRISYSLRRSAYVPRRFVSAILPSSLRRWLKSRIFGAQT
jgi:lipopolysaccharide biosynthesis glycosyltransferase